MEELLRSLKIKVGQLAANKTLNRGFQNLQKAGSKPFSPEALKADLVAGTNIIRSAIPKPIRPFAEPVLNTSTNLMQTAGTGAYNVITGGGRIAQGVIEQDPLKAASGAFRTIKGAGQAYAPGVQYLADYASHTLPQESGVARLLGGYSEGVSQADLPYKVAPQNTVNINPLNLLEEDIEFDPYKAVGGMIGFVKNPTNQKIFQTTNKLFNESKIANFFVKNGIRLARGSVEGMIQGLADLPDNLTEDEIKDYMTQQIAYGAGSEVVVGNIADGLKGVIGSLWKQLKPYVGGDKWDMTVTTTRIDSKTGERIKMPYWKWKLSEIQPGLTTKSTDDVFKAEQASKGAQAGLDNVPEKLKPLAQEARKYKSADEFNDLAFDNILEDLRGVKRDSIVTIPTKDVEVIWKDDYTNALETAKKSYNPETAPPVEFIYDIKTGKYKLDDGHNRYVSALNNGQPLKGEITKIDGNTKELADLYKKEKGISPKDIWNKANVAQQPLTDVKVKTKQPKTKSSKLRIKDKPKSGSDSIYSSQSSIPFIRRLQEKVQDSWLRARQLQKQEGVVVKKDANPYLAEELYHGRKSARLETVKSTVTEIDKELVKTAKTLGVSDATLKNDINKYLQAKHAPERNKMHGDGAAGMTTKEAKQVLSELSNKKGVKKIASRVQELNKKTLDILYEGQVISKETYETLQKTYKNHVPLNRIMDDTGDVTDILVNKGFNVRGSGIKRAKGSEKEVADILTNVFANIQAAIVRAEKNRVDLATLRFARNNPDLGIFQEIKPKAIGRSFDGEGMVMEKIDDPLVLSLRENGNPVHLRIADEKLATVYQGVGNERLPEFFNFVNTFTRFYSSLHTRFNPEFAPSNLVRDVQEMAVYASSKKELGGAKGAAQITKDVPKMQKAVVDYLRGKNTSATRLYKQMQLDGGTTGGMALSTRKNIEIDVENIMKLNRSNPRQAVQKLLQGFDNWNQVFEDGTRLAVYKRALDNGVSREQAASLAKNATVNFNKKGTSGAIINSLYMFSNASIQGSVKMLRAMKNPKVLAGTTATVGAAVWATNSWNDSVDPDWREKISKWDKTSNLPILIPTNQGEGVRYFTLPVSWGIKPIKVAADVAYEASTGKTDSVVDGVERVVGSAIDAYNPAGGQDIISSATPSILDTPLEIARNKAWHGGLIRPYWLQNKPRSMQHFKDVEDTQSGRIAKAITDTLAEKTGNIMQISPEDLLYAYNAYIGGVGKFATRVTSTGAALLQGESPDAKDVPFTNRFYKTKSEEYAQASLHSNLKKKTESTSNVSKSEEKQVIRNLEISAMKGEETSLMGDDKYYWYDPDTGNAKVKFEYDFIHDIPTSKYTQAKKQDKLFDLGLKIYRDEDVPQEDKEGLYAKLGINKDDLEYYTIAVDKVDLKTEYVTEQLGSMENRELLIKYIIDNRRMVGGQMLISNGVLDNLYDEGIISKDEKNTLKKFKIDGDGEVKMKTSGRGGGAKLKKAKFVPLNIAKTKVSAPKAPQIATTTPNFDNIRFNVPKLRVRVPEPSTHRVQFNI